MFNTLSNSGFLFGAFVLALIQVAAAIPWLFSLEAKGFRESALDRQRWINIGYGAGIAFIGLAVLLAYDGASKQINWYGRLYGIVLHIQILADVLIWLPHILAFFLPKTGAVALAAYRESWRQPMFWLIALGGLIATWIAVVLPYFTFGDDYKMFKLIGFDIIMLASLLFGAIAASISVSEEIEGRTAITVMSKPISRRSFLVGKFLGIVLACFGLAMILTINLNFALLANREFDQINYDRSVDRMAEQAKDAVLPLVSKAFPTAPLEEFAKWAATWLAECYTHGLGVLFCFGQVTILVAIAVAIATRLHFIVSLLVVLFVYLAGHLAPVISKVTESRGGGGSANVVVGFLAKVFDVLMPSLEYYNMGPAVVRDTPLDLGQFALYALTVSGYSALYTAIALIVGLLLFDDRDLA